MISSALGGTSSENSSLTSEKMRDVLPTPESPTSRMRTSLCPSSLDVILLPMQLQVARSGVTRARVLRKGRREQVMQEEREDEPLVT